MDGMTLPALLLRLYVPIILAFTGAFLIHQRGASGQLESTFLQERVFPSLRRVSSFFTDLKFKIRGVRPPNPRVVVVEIDSNAIHEMGRWPWRRDFVAYLVDTVFKSGAKAVGLDLVFSEPDPHVPPEMIELLTKKGWKETASWTDPDAAFEKVIKAYANQTVLAWMTEADCRPRYSTARECPVSDPSLAETIPANFTKFSLGRVIGEQFFQPETSPFVAAPTLISNLGTLETAAQHAGFANSFPDPDGSVRRGSLIMMVKGRPYPSLPLELARVALGEELEMQLKPGGTIERLAFRKSGRVLPVSGSGMMEINFRGPARTLTYVSALDLLRDDDKIQDEMNRRLTGITKSEVFKDAIVFIGVSALGLGDVAATPFDSHSPGVEVQATILDNLLAGDLIDPGTQWTALMALILLMTAGALIFGWRASSLSARGILTMSAIGLMLCGFADAVLFNYNHNWGTGFFYLEMLALVTVTLVAKYLFEEHDKRLLRLALSKYVSPVVVDNLIKQPSLLVLGGKRTKLTILFSDIRGFSTISEHMEAPKLAEFLNEYLSLMTEVIFEHGGTIDKYIGDAVMAFWGAPLEDASQARRCCEAARQMLQVLNENRARFKEKYGVDLRIGIGINTGWVSVGNMGSARSFNYTAIGDDVNLAARLEQATKYYKAELIVSSFTFQDLKSTGMIFGAYRLLDRVVVRGKSHAVDIIQLFPDQSQPDALREFSLGHDAYVAKDWPQAIAHFEACREIFARAGVVDGPSELFIERCRDLEQDPPPADWDGSWDLAESHTTNDTH
jgi:adenylate cyclase